MQLQAPANFRGGKTDWRRGGDVRDRRSVPKCNYRTRVLERWEAALAVAASLPEFYLATGFHLVPKLHLGTEPCLRS